jgi:hypothetical protein
VAQLNSALDYGSRGYWFESSRGHYSQKAPIEDNWSLFHLKKLLINILANFSFPSTYRGSTQKRINKKTCGAAKIKHKY